VKSAAPQQLVHELVAEAGDPSLVQQRRLEPAMTALEDRGETGAVELVDVGAEGAGDLLEVEEQEQPLAVTAGGATPPADEGTSEPLWRGALEQVGIVDHHRLVALAGGVLGDGPAVLFEWRSRRSVTTSARDDGAAPSLCVTVPF